MLIFPGVVGNPSARVQALVALVAQRVDQSSLDPAAHAHAEHRCMSYLHSSPPSGWGLNSLCRARFLVAFSSRSFIARFFEDMKGIGNTFFSGLFPWSRFFVSILFDWPDSVPR
jgi:hypothetical protein